MGGSLSEPATLVDIQECIYRCSTSKQYQHSCGWQYLDYSFSDLVTGLTHVDDSLILSKIYCPQCLFDRVLRTFPKDFGMSLEETGQTIRFLSTFVFIDLHNLQAHTQPYNPNIPFALGLVHTQKTARLGRYLGIGIHDFRYFFQFFLGRILVYHHLVRGKVASARLHLLVLIYEVLRLDWPLDYVIRSLQKIPRRHQSAFLSYCRQLSRELKDEEQRVQLLHTDNIDKFIRKDQVSQAILQYLDIPNTFKKQPIAHSWSMGWGGKNGKGSGYGQNNSQGSWRSWLDRSNWGLHQQQQQSQQPLVIAPQFPSQPAPAPTIVLPPNLGMPISGFPSNQVANQQSVVSATQQFPQPGQYPFQQGLASPSVHPGPSFGPTVYPPGLQFSNLSVPGVPPQVTPELLFAQAAALKEQLGRVPTPTQGHEDEGYVILRSTRQAVRRLARKDTDPEPPSGKVPTSPADSSAATAAAQAAANAAQQAVNALTSVVEKFTGKRPLEDPVTPEPKKGVNEFR